MQMKKLETLKPGKFVIFIMPSGYKHFPWRFMEGRLIGTDYNRYENVAGDNLSDYGELPIGYFEIPTIQMESSK